MRFLDAGFQKLEHEQDRQTHTGTQSDTRTDETERCEGCVEDFVKCSTQNAVLWLCHVCNAAGWYSTNVGRSAKPRRWPVGYQPRQEEAGSGTGSFLARDGMPRCSVLIVKFSKDLVMQL